YECLDIHHRLLGKGLISQTLRRLEGKLLKEVRGIVISSPAFEAEYFDKMHPDHPRALLLENKLPLRRLPPRPARKQSCDQQLTLGWVGILRCQRSLNILMEIAEAMRGRVKVKLHGKPALTAIPHFYDLVEETENLTYEGPYQSPDDLDDIYGHLDLIWAGDYYQTGGNSEWLLPNRLYEGGYFGVPALAPAGTQTARWITTHGTGHVIEGEPDTSLIPFLSTLIAKNELNALQQKVLSAPTSLFAEYHSALDGIIKGVLS
ncbi:MAG: glycosyl transferase, partial [Pseudomonadota bacterium]